MTSRRTLWLLIVACLATGVGRLPSLHAQDTASLQGVVRAEGTATPLAGARVDAIRAGRSIDHAISGQNGRFLIPLRAGGDVAIVVTKAGYAPFRTTAATGQALDVRLIPGAVLTGRALDATGRPQADFFVRVRRAADGGAPPGPWTTVVTNDLGEYRLGSLAAGAYDVGVHPASVLVATTGNAAVASAMSATRVFRNEAFTGLEQVPGMPAPVAVDLHAGRETVHNVLRPEAPATGPQAPSAAQLGATLESLRTRLGGPRVDPNTAGRITGVVAGFDGRPVPAIVRLQPQDGSPQYMALADESGRYEFGAVAPGAYRILARSGGTMEAEYGATASTRAGVWVTVRERQRVDRLDITLPRAGVVSGRIVDAFGEPLEGLMVDAWQQLTFAGRTMLYPAVSASTGTTDDRGQYRLHGLMPGRYYIVASEPAAAASMPPPGGGGPQAPLQLALSSAMSMVSTPPRPHSYYPGRPLLQEASPVAIDVGVDAHGLDMTFVPTQGVPVSGIVRGPDGAPLAAQVTLTVSRRSGAPLLPAYHATSGADGAFSFPYVVPGEYVLQAEGQRPGGLFDTVLAAASAGVGGLMGTSASGATTADVLSMFGGGAAWTAGNVPAFATTYVVVAGAEVPPVTLRAATGSALAGRITFEGPGQPPAPTRFALGFAPADTDLARGIVPPVRATADGTFEAFGLFGPTRLMAAAAPDGWWLESATIDGLNAAEQSVTFGPSEAPRHMDIVFSSVRSGVGGRVRSGSGGSADAAAVLVFPMDWTQWHAGIPFVKRAPVAGGQFELPALAPGTYAVVAVDAAAAAAVIDAQDRDQLTRLLGSARPVTVRKGSMQRVDLTVADVPR